MNEARAVSVEAIVLRRVDYGETDRIVTILTPELGRISFLAKGVRKPSSKLAGGIEPLAIVEVTVRKGRGELWTLTSSRMNTFFDQILADYNRLQFAYVVLKKVQQAAETLQDAALYELLKVTLMNLHTKTIDRRVTEAWFRVQFISLLGHGLNLARDTNNEKLAEEKRYNFSVDDMAFVPIEQGQYQADHLKVLKLLQLKTPAVINQIGGIERVIDDCLRLLRVIDE
ncbi:MAG TPA: DNA repair protein RecO [Candidatus Saccharimonadales bacterium]